MRRHRFITVLLAIIIKYKYKCKKCMEGITKKALSGLFQAREACANEDLLPRLKKPGQGKMLQQTEETCLCVYLPLNLNEL